MNGNDQKKNRAAAEAMPWLYDLKQSELREVMKKHGKDMLMVYEHCRFDTLVDLWVNLPSISIYVSERALNEARKIHVRKHFNPGDPDSSAKALAVELRVSTQFVREALSADGATDPRQGNLFEVK